MSEEWNDELLLNLTLEEVAHWLARAAAAADGCIIRLTTQFGDCYRAGMYTSPAEHRRLNATLRSAIDALLTDGRITRCNDEAWELTAKGYAWADERLQMREAHASQTNARAVIVSALPVEYHAVRSYLTQITETTHHGTVYETGLFTRNKVSWQVSILETGMGNASAAVETERAINIHQPSVVLFVGVAGGLKDATIGDVVAATQVYGYEAGKQGEQFKARPNVGTSSYALVQRAKAEARKTTWRETLVDPSAGTPRVLIGPIAAGEKVLTSSTTALRTFLDEYYNDARAVEMEGRGFLAATYANHETQSIVIRGISDLLDGKADSDKAGAQQRAAQHASAFAYHLLATFRPESKMANPTPTTPASPDQPLAADRQVETNILAKLLDHAGFYTRVLQLIDDISTIPHHAITNIARPPEYERERRPLHLRFNEDYHAFQRDMSTARALFAEEQAHATGVDATEIAALIAAIREVETTVSTLATWANNRVDAIERAKIPWDKNNDATQAAQALTTIVTQRLRIGARPSVGRTRERLS